MSSSEGERPTDLGRPVDHPRTEEQTRAHLDRRRRCARLVRDGYGDQVLDMIEQAALRVARRRRR